MVFPLAFIADAFRKGAGVAELAALEMLCTSKGYRGFESHPFRQIFTLMKLWLQAPHKAWVVNSARRGIEQR
jgi:hypothetical protein